MTDYSLLDKNTNYDVERARVFAQAVAEVRELEKRVEYLTNLVKDNQELSRYCWTSLDGRTQVIADIPDDHLVNIARHIQRDGSYKSNPVVDAEIAKRGLVVPAPTMAIMPSIEDIELDDDIIDLDDVGF